MQIRRISQYISLALRKFYPVNPVFLALILGAIGTAAFRQISGADADSMARLASAALEAAEKSVTLALGLVGVMALFLGLMKIAEAGGLLVILAKLLRPLMRRLFPDVPENHPAMGAMVLNLSANMLGLGNAATPFGIRAMQELDRLNPHKKSVSDAMAMFLVINTANITLLPTSVIALRAAAGSTDPAGVVAPTLVATIFSTFAAVLAVRFLRPWFPLPKKAVAPPSAEITSAPTETDALPDFGPDYPAWASWLAFAILAACVPLTLLWGRMIGPWIVPGFLAGLLLFGWLRGVKVYEAFVQGASEAFTVALRIIPYLVAILTAVAMLRASGALDLLITPLGRLTEPLGLPPEGLLMGLLRSLSGSGAYGYLAALMNDPAVGPDSYLGYLAGTIQASTETTFYVLAVYCGAVGISRMRHALAAGLIADAVGVAAAVMICQVLFA